MPLYEFICDACDCAFEEIVSTEAEAPPCPKCSSNKTRKLLSAVHVKGNPSPLKDYGARPYTPPPSRGGGCGGGGFT